MLTAIHTTRCSAVILSQDLEVASTALIPIFRIGLVLIRLYAINDDIVVLFFRTDFADTHVAPVRHSARRVVSHDSKHVLPQAVCLLSGCFGFGCVPTKPVHLYFYFWEQ